MRLLRCTKNAGCERFILRFIRRLTRKLSQTGRVGISYIKHPHWVPAAKMTAYERAVLSHYNLSTAFPAEWPAEKDGAEDSDEAGSPNPELKSRSPLQRSKSRYSALEYLGTEGQTSFIRWDRTGPEHENPPRTDEPDPLGSSDSVVRLLRQRGLPVDDDAQLSMV